jgi:hypothetical protein
LELAMFAYQYAIFFVWRELAFLLGQKIV